VHVSLFWLLDRHKEKSVIDYSPEAASAPISALLNTSTMSISRLPPTEPLCAPSLVIAACLEFGVPLGQHVDHDAVDASFVLSCLNAASSSSSSSAAATAKTSDVSVTIGANTKLTISPDFEQGPVRRSGQLRRSRSGEDLEKLFSSSPTKRSIKLDRLTLANLSILTKYLA
jgi:hypothetical protein